MKYSILIPFRDRVAHLELLIPRLREVFKDKDFEIIVTEQNDDKPFRKSSLLNIATRYATGDIFVFHDVDYYPKTVDYFTKSFTEETSYGYLPVETVTFVDINLDPLPIEQVPSGYRHFKDEVDADFMGGVVMLNKRVFDAINGFNPLYVGWGLEDADIRERCTLKYPLYRGSGQYLALPHLDSNPGDHDANLQANTLMYQNARAYQAKFGKNNVDATIQKYQSDLANTWLRISEFKIV